MFFYYDIDKNIYTDKFTAVQSKKKIFLYYYDKEFTQLDWSIEPTESLEALYLDRARQIRDENKYLVLCYSGGSDSTNILNTFVKNNIFLDEILVVGALSQDSNSDSDENHNGELYKNVFPYLQSLNLKNTKITVFDYTKNIDSASLLNSDNWFTEINGYYSIHNWHWHDLSIDYYENEKALIFGIDKPLLVRDNKCYYTYFTDDSAIAYGYSNKIKRINFYWEPKAQKIIAKQCYSLIDIYEKVHPSILANNYTSVINFVCYGNLKLPFYSKKSKSKIISLRDNYAIKKQSKVIDKFKKDFYLLNNLQALSQTTFTKKYKLCEV